ncbi:Hypothetical_protein [Hexamita inflata]|uniref:Hypothetical_protein n=1 Tax=Hexamita inflata TaxID=28002 RepID=A0ABP1KZU1_9EUKA
MWKPNYSLRIQYFEPHNIQPSKIFSRVTKLHAYQPGPTLTRKDSTAGPFQWTWPRRWLLSILSSDGWAFAKTFGLEVEWVLKLHVVKFKRMPFTQTVTQPQIQSSYQSQLFTLRA